MTRPAVASVAVLLSAALLLLGDLLDGRSATASLLDPSAATQVPRVTPTADSQADQLQMLADAGPTDAASPLDRARPLDPTTSVASGGGGSASRIEHMFDSGEGERAAAADPSLLLVVGTGLLGVGLRRLAG